MARLIDADVFEVVTFDNKSEEFIKGAQYILEMIDAQPTAYDVDANESKSMEKQKECEDCAGCTSWKCDCSNVRNKAIDDFVKVCEKKFTDMILSHQGQLDFASGLAVANRMLDDVAEQLKESDVDG